MRTLAGTAENISRPIVGRVDRVKRRGGTVTATLVRAAGAGGERVELFPAPVGLAKRRRPAVHGVQRLDLLSDGDVVEVAPDGRITVLYSPGSNDNALFLTDRCNCSCVICPQVPDPSAGGHLERNKAILTLMPPTAEVLAITGGEPTAAPEELLEVLRVCRRRLPRTHLEVLTNGVALDDERLVDAIVGVRHPGISFHVPLYSDDEALHNEITGSEGFFRTLGGLRNLARHGQEIELRTVVTALNCARLPQWASFVARNLPFVSRVAIMGLEPMGRARENIGRVWVDPVDTVEPLTGAVHVLRRAGLTAWIYGYQLCVLPERLRPYSRRAISDWKNIFLPVCRTCASVPLCGGFFASQAEHHSRGLCPLGEGGSA